MTDRFLRQSFLGEDSEARIKGATASVVGLCGGGSHVSQQLAHIGLGAINGIDFDHVESSNNNRMIGSSPTHAQNKDKKVDVIGNLVRAISPDTIYTPLDGKWQDFRGHLNASTGVFGCVDSYSQRNQLEAYARRFMLPYIDVGMDVRQQGDEFFITGQIIVSLPGRPCMHCMGFLTPALLAAEESKYGDVGDRPQVVWPNGVLASTAVGLFMKMLTPWAKQDLPLYLDYDGNRHIVQESSRSEYFKDKICPHYPVGDVGDPFFKLKL